MASYPLSFPSKRPSSETLRLMRRQASMASPFTLQQQTINTASQWTLEFNWPPMRLPEAEKLRAWIDSLRGAVGSFLYSPTQSQTSNLTGKAIGLTGYAYNNTVKVVGWGSSVASGLRAGQFFQIGNQLLQITNAPSTSDITGACIIEFEPSLRHNAAPGAPVNFAAPMGLFRLASAEGVGFTLNSDKMPTFTTLQCMEVVE